MNTTTTHPAGAPKAISAAGLGFGYPGRGPVLEGVTIEAAAAERVGVIGPNGAGKTTLFMLLCGVLAPTEGTLEVFGATVEPGAFRPEIGMVFHHTNDQLICPTVREDIAFGPQNTGLLEEAVSARVHAAAAATGIAHLLDRTPHELSSGEQRLVAITGILAMEPRLLILDEPTSDLDLRYRRRLIRLIERMEGQTVIVASHDLEFILETCGRVLLLDAGRIQADGAPAEIMADEGLMAAHGLEVPHSLVATWHRHRGSGVDEHGDAAG